MDSLSSYKREERVNAFPLSTEELMLWHGVGQTLITDSLACFLQISVEKAGRKSGVAKWTFRIKIASEKPAWDREKENFRQKIKNN